MPSPLAALSPLDGRYSRGADPLRAYFSEQALIRYRVRIELEWLQEAAHGRLNRIVHAVGVNGDVADKVIRGSVHPTLVVRPPRAVL